ncbi:signal recognition particle 19 kDa protein [Metallosphaera yellowstonensis MK1]|jgi:signal recognition particle subunit SRP19|uniref:Signal recognition particle 19 kDa protein n=1 Tax=Metallosphaera yellowstonensis MK1 TaxID=671065 RepID=H2C623_9CREN|nr:hypothetical protein [Metallosphaera yellowstonensis]EHP69250.1 signal recognition particle 19 kDa protein [Metallosphaera yellowstonensis MK1]
MSLRDYEGKKVVVWLAYFTAPSRRKGRLFPSLKVGLAELEKVTKELNLNPEVLDKIHPGSRIRGAVAVDKGFGGKGRTLKAIYEALRSLK